MNKAKIWAEDYFKRFEAMVKELNQNKLINKVVYIQFEGLTEADIIAAEQKINESLNEDAEDMEIEGFPFKEDFVFDDYMKEFYKISNGLNLSWNSHIFPTKLEKSETLKNRPISEMRFPDTGGDFNDEGFVCLFGLDNILWPSAYKFSVDGPSDTGYGEELGERGWKFCHLDYFHYYYDAAIEIKKGETLNIVLGEDHSACYENWISFDFVMYMEFVLATYGSAHARGRNFHFKAKGNINFEKKSESVFKKKDYPSFIELMEKNYYSNLEYTLKEHFEEDREFCNLENFKSKTAETYKHIENVLGIIIEEEFE